MLGRWSRRLPLALLATVALVVGAAGPAHGDQVVRLSHDAVRNLGLATLTGSVPASQPITVGVYLANPRQAAEDAYVKSLYSGAAP